MQYNLLTDRLFYGKIGYIQKGGVKMESNKIAIKINELKSEIEKLPVGYISKKNIKGKTRYYHQWTELGKIKSKYIKDGELEDLQKKIEKRRKLQSKLKTFEKEVPKMKNIPVTQFNTKVSAGEELLQMTETVKEYEKRDCYNKIQKFLKLPAEPRVCVIYGLRRTGKTTMLLQTILEMNTDELSKTVYIKANPSDTMGGLNKDLELLHKSGIKNVFIDEITLIEDFIDSAAVLSDIYAAMGMKLILSGTDSLGFWLAKNQELYDRAYSIHTTFIPFAEYSRLLKKDDIDEYIRYGGTLRAGEIDFDDEELLAEESAFRSDESTRRYIDTAISKNIQHSLECCRDGVQFRHLYSLYEADELTSAINRIIEDMNHRFILKVLTRNFKSNDLGISTRNLRKEPDPEKRTTVLDDIDVQSVTKRLMEILEIRNEEDMSIGITNTHVEEIKEYLKALDLIYYTSVETNIIGAESEENIVFTQPGMRYCQAQVLVHSLMKDSLFKEQNEKVKNLVSERILSEVRGRMLEDIVLMETTKNLNPKQYMVFKLITAGGEFDMVIYDRERNVCGIYEIKRSDKSDSNQYRHLIDDEECAPTERRFGTIVNKTVLYRGDSFDTENGIKYRNVEEYLKNTIYDFKLEVAENDIAMDNGMNQI